ncbi:hypothetical protein VTI28DRAFT_5173 [Corynascus sepedonium]
MGSVMAAERGEGSLGSFGYGSPAHFSGFDEDREFNDGTKGLVVIWRGAGWLELLHDCVTACSGGPPFMRPLSLELGPGPQLLQRPICAWGLVGL